MMIHVTEANFNETVLRSEKPFIFVMGAPWCPDCRRVEPFVKKLLEAYGERVGFGGLRLRNQFYVAHEAVPRRIIRAPRGVEILNRRIFFPQHFAQGDFCRLVGLAGQNPFGQLARL